MKETHSVTGYYIDKSDLVHTAPCIKVCELMLQAVELTYTTAVPLLRPRSWLHSVHGGMTAE